MEKKKKIIQIREKVANSNLASLVRTRTLKMRLLIDKWSPTVLVLFAVIKILQFGKWLGFKTQESGWRKATRSYLRTEHAKFTLAAFRLNLVHSKGDISLPQICARLAEFLKAAPKTHWQLEWGRFAAWSRKKRYVDVIGADYAKEGTLRSIHVLLDRRGPLYPNMTSEFCALIHTRFIEEYNRVLNVPDKKRPRQLKHHMYLWVLQYKGCSILCRFEAREYIDRLLSATFVSLERIEVDSLKKGARYFEPNFIKRKHPGHGLLNIICRFWPESNECDMWFQFHHVPVDGVPMQELLSELKSFWGTRGEIMFPRLTEIEYPATRICSTERGKRALYQAQRFYSFDAFLNMRRELNDRLQGELEHSITIISMFIWGLAHHKSFYDRKFVFTVDLTECDVSGRDRGLGFVFIRPSLFFNRDNPLGAFIEYQQEFNRRLYSTRHRHSESYELLELYALTNELMYGLVRRLFPKALRELVGTIGLTIIRDADLFITPLTDIHTDGFFAFGNLTVPTVDGNTAGAVSVRAPRSKIDGYLAALSETINHFERFVY